MHQQDHQHVGPLFVCTNSNCDSQFLCCQIDCLLAHKHAVNLISVPCLNLQVEEFMSEKLKDQQQLQKIVEQYYDQAIENFISLAEQAKAESIRKLKEISSISSIKQLKPIVQGANIKQLSKQKIIQINSFIHSKIDDLKLNHIQSILKDKKQTIRADLHKFVQTFLKLNLDKNLIGYHFSQLLKGDSMQICKQGKMVIQNTYNGQFQRFCFIQYQLSIDTPSQIQITVGLNSWIGVGILAKNQLLDIDLKFQYSDLVKGIYMISSNGYSWQHNDRYINNDMSFKDGDKIQVQFDPIVLQVRFKIKSKLLIMQVSQQLVFEGNIYFGVNLSSHGDSCLINQ